MHRSVGDYRSPLAGAVSTLANQSAGVREELYERARSDATVAELQKFEQRASHENVLTSSIGRCSASVLPELTEIA